MAQIMTRRFFLKGFGVFLVAVSLPKIGRWIMSYQPVDSYIKYMWEHPASCMASLACAPHGELVDSLVEYGDYATMFGIKCPCGNQSFQLKGKDIETGYAGISAPIQAVCAGCEKKHLIFDGTKHGYDAELGLSCSHNEEFKDKDVICPTCGGTNFLVAVAFQYGGEEQEIIDEDNLDKKREDLFSWFSGHARCESCKHVFEFTSIECA